MLVSDPRRLVISYNPIMAAKDRKDRQRLLDRLGKLANAEGKVAMKDVIKNNGSKKYLQLDADKKTAKIRWDKADNDAAWDGISGYITNSTKPVGEVITDSTSACGRSKMRFVCANTTSRCVLYSIVKAIASRHIWIFASSRMR